MQLYLVPAKIRAPLPPPVCSVFIFYFLSGSVNIVDLRTHLQFGLACGQSFSFCCGWTNFLLQAPLINHAALSEGFGFPDEGHLFQIKGEFLIFGSLKWREIKMARLGVFLSVVNVMREEEGLREGEAGWKETTLETRQRQKVEGDRLNRQDKTLKAVWGGTEESDRLSSF